MFSNRLKILDDFGIVAIAVAAAVIGATRALTLKKGYHLVLHCRIVYHQASRTSGGVEHKTVCT